MAEAIKLNGICTSPKEIRDIVVAWLAITLAFAIAFHGFSLSSKFLYFLLISAFTVGIGFLLHELSHKIVAQGYGCMAEFRSFDMMLLIMLALATFGFVFAAPGAVMIVGKVTKKENGIISVAGPMTNFVLAGIFYLLLLAFGLGGEVLTTFLYTGFKINAWLGLFNLIPILNLDGRKVFEWNIPVWVGMAAIGVVMSFVL